MKKAEASQHRKELETDKPIMLNPDFWDCECEENYIHPKSICYCPVCCTRAEDQPDSRQSEIDVLLSEANNG